MKRSTTWACAAAIELTFAISPWMSPAHWKAVVDSTLYGFALLFALLAILAAIEESK